MRANAILLLLALAACGGDPADSNPEGETHAFASDGFLQYLPENPRLVARLPSTGKLAEAPTAIANLLRCLGYGAEDTATLVYRAANLAGIDTARAAGFVALPTGGWIHYLPAADKGQLNQALSSLVTKYVLQEDGDWISIGALGAKPGRTQGEPLPPGDVAGRWKHHPLLDAVAQPGDTLELAGTLLDGGIECTGRLVPGNNSPTAEAVQNAGGELAGHLDLLPPWLGVRFETTLPTTIYATLLTRRIARHAGLEQGELRDNLERFLREALTGIDAKTGLAVGIDFRDGNASFVAVGSIAEGTASPVLAKLPQARRTTFGGLVLDEREASKGITGFYAWCPQAEPNLDVPESLVNVLANLLNEDSGVLVSYLAAEGYAVVAAGPQADSLARKVGRRIVSGAQGSVGGRHLGQLVRRGGKDCVLGAVVSGPGLSGMASADRAALRSLLHAGPDAEAPKLVVLAGFRREAGSLQLEGRVVYR